MADLEKNIPRRLRNYGAYDLELEELECEHSKLPPKSDLVVLMTDKYKRRRRLDE